MLIALTREVSPHLGRCELAFSPRMAIDAALARRQHLAYEDALSELGARTERVAAAPELPDGVFVEDPAVVLDELVILTRPGAASRRGETASLAAALRAYRSLERIEAPGTLDGGDVLRLGRTLYVGLSGRTNLAGVERLRQLVARHGYGVEPVEVRRCLHLKSAVTAIGPGRVLVNPAWVDPGRFEGVEVLEIDPAEPHGANALRVGERVLYPSSFPRTRERLEAHGLAVSTVDVSELQKAEGAVTCCSLLFEASTPA